MLAPGSMRSAEKPSCFISSCAFSRRATRSASDIGWGGGGAARPGSGGRAGRIAEDKLAVPHPVAPTTRDQRRVKRRSRQARHRVEEALCDSLDPRTVDRRKYCLSLRVARHTLSAGLTSSELELPN